MDSNKETISTSELPDSLFSKTSNILHSYSTGLIRIPDRPPDQEEANLIGSGTFVSIDGVKGILTAHHVAELLELGDSLALILVPDEHRNEIPFQLLSIIEIARGSNESEGPDLSFIVLPRGKIAEIRPYKQFFDLSGYRDGMLMNRPDPHIGIWFLCGIPDEYTIEEESERGLGRIKTFSGVAMLVGPNREYSHSGFDYIEADIEYNEYTQPPYDFGGVSGSGLWFVPIKSSGGEFEPADFILTGVAFYQSEIRDQKRFIKCHGPTSLYEILYEAVRSRS